MLIEWLPTNWMKYQIWTSAHLLEKKVVTGLLLTGTEDSLSVCEEQMCSLNIYLALHARQNYHTRKHEADWIMSNIVLGCSVGPQGKTAVDC